MKNAAVAEKSHGQEVLQDLHARFKAEVERRQTNSDPDEATAMVICAREVKRLTAIATNPNESSDTRLEAAMRGLDLAGMTARSARFREVDPSEMTLPELRNVLIRIEFELEDRVDRLAEVKAELCRRAAA
jgi:hypothetical protein